MHLLPCRMLTVSNRRCGIFTSLKKHGCRRLTKCFWRSGSEWLKVSSSQADRWNELWTQTCRLWTAQVVELAANGEFEVLMNYWREILWYLSKTWYNHIIFCDSQFLMSRSLEFFCSFTSLLVSEYRSGRLEDSLTRIISVAYEESLRKHHNWFMRATFFVRHNFWLYCGEFD